MNDNRTPDYGLDAPVAVRNMLIVAALGIISLIARLLGVWSRQDVIAVIARPLMVGGLSFGAMALWMIYDSKIGKVRERDTYLDKINWNGHERVLDVGCGLGLFLIGAAKRLSTGRAVGIDKWQQEDLSGNNAAGTLRNAMIEGVADKVEVHTGRARNRARVGAWRARAHCRRAAHVEICRHFARRRVDGCALRARRVLVSADADHVRLGAMGLRDRQQIVMRFDVAENSVGS